MTDELYKELKDRLLEEGFISKDNPAKNRLAQKELQFLDRAHQHFKARQKILHELSMSRGRSDWTDHDLCMICYGWDNMRKLVLWSYGVSRVRHLPDDKQDEINDLAIKIIDTVFDQYSKLWEEP